MKITEDSIRIIYECLIQLHPFNTWKLPPSRKIDFEVVNDKELMGSYTPDPHCICISKARHSHYDTVCRTMAHEIVHLKMYLDGFQYELHDKNFDKLKKQIADEFGYDFKEL